MNKLTQAHLNHAIDGEIVDIMWPNLRYTYRLTYGADGKFHLVFQLGEFIAVTSNDNKKMIATSFQLDGATMNYDEYLNFEHNKYEAEIAADVYKMEAEAESAWLRHAENAGWMEVAAEEYHDFLRGVRY